MRQERRITYQAGITRTPSDFLCKDGELAECFNLATDNEELKPIVPPKLKFELRNNFLVTQYGSFIILCVHRQDDQVRYIGYWENNIRLSFGTVTVEQSGNYLDVKNPVPASGTPPLGGLTYDSQKTKVTTMGKILIISNEYGMNYFKWMPDGSYKNLGRPEPPVVRVMMYGEGVVRNSMKTSGIIEGILEPPNEKKILDRERYNDLIAGMYAKNKKSVANMKGFCLPFFVRTALEMYDGTYTFISQPVFMLPFVRENSVSYFWQYDDNDEPNRMHMATWYRKLMVELVSDYSDWSDIVKGVTLFVSDGVELHNLNTDMNIDFLRPPVNSDDPDESTATWHDNYIDSVFIKLPQGMYNGYKKIKVTTVDPSETDVYWHAYKDGDDNFGVPGQPLVNKGDSAILEDLKGVSQFYKLCDLGRTSFDMRNAGDMFEYHVLVNLTARPQLKQDDYFSRSKLTASMLYPYNGRLNLAGVKRSLFEGYDFFMTLTKGMNQPGAEPADDTYYFYVKIKVEDGSEKWVKHEGKSTDMQGIYFFYPDQRACHVTIYNASTEKYVCDAELNEHRMLNGAYYLRELPDADTEETEVTVGQDGYHGETLSNSFMEILPNYIVTSEVDNPWVYQALGYNRVGTGKIIGMTANTQALSQGQFGQYPLLVFSESGIWAMSVDGTGMYQSVTPMSREVCVNARTITQTDNAVFFASKKGLMMVAGSNVVCVSEMMDGKAFVAAELPGLSDDDITPNDSPVKPWEYLVKAGKDARPFPDVLRSENCTIAYDYRESRLLIFSSRVGYFEYQHVFNIADNTFSKTFFQLTNTGFVGAVNDYPDTLIQGIDLSSGQRINKVFSLYDKDSETDVLSRQVAYLVTRPMKIAGPVAVASLRELVNVGQWKKKDAQGNELSCVKTDVWQSDDLYTWYPAESRFGAAAKYFRIGLYIKMLPTERLSGTIITEQERRTDNQRA